MRQVLLSDLLRVGFGGRYFVGCVVGWLKRASQLLDLLKPCRASVKSPGHLIFSSSSCYLHEANDLHMRAAIRHRVE